MTREEAREILTHNWTRVDNPNYSESELDEAFFMAIEALNNVADSENDAVESKNDVIKRQDAVNEIHKYFVEEIDKTPTEIDEDWDELYADMPTVNSLLACNKELSKRIKALPSADRPTGKCRTCGRNADNGGVHEDGRTKCPIQEHYALLLDGYCHLYEPYNCGAKMTKGGEDDADE